MLAHFSSGHFIFLNPKMLNGGPVFHSGAGEHSVKCLWECKWTNFGACVGRVWTIVMIQLCICGAKRTISVKLERFTGRLIIFWCCLTLHIDEWSPPSGMSTCAIPSFQLRSEELALVLLGFTATNGHVLKKMY